MQIFKKVASVAALVLIASTSCFAASGTVTTDALNIRSAPSTDSTVIAKAYTGDVLDVTGTDGSFYVINYNGTTAYTSRDYVSVGSSASTGTITTNGLNVREKPDSSSAAVGKLSSGDTVNIVGSSGSWYEILLYGELRYVHSDYVEKGSAPAQASSSQSAKTGKVTTDGLNVRADASSSSSVIGRLSTGDTVKVTGSSGNWHRIDYSGKTGYVHSDYVSFDGDEAVTASAEPAKTGTITTDGLNVRADASSSSSVIGRLSTGDTVKVTGSSGNWHRIDYSGKTGYVHSDYVTFDGKPAKSSSYDSAKTGTITTNGLNIRAEASSNSAVVGKLSSGDTVDVTGSSGEWYKISFSGQTGYIHSDYVTVETSTKRSSGSGTSATVITDGLNVRADASSDSKSLDKLYYGDSVKIIGTSGAWYEISYSGKTGYVHGDYITTKDVSVAGSSRSAHSFSREGGNLVEYSKKFIGVPYVSGGASPSGFDCSGFTSYVFAQFGYSIPRTAAAQAAVGTPVSKSELAPGDLVFFNTYGGISHVGIFTGGDSFIHATVPGDVVKIGSLSTPYYKRTYVTARRILK